MPAGTHTGAAHTARFTAPGAARAERAIRVRGYGNFDIIMSPCNQLMLCGLVMTRLTTTGTQTEVM